MVRVYGLGCMAQGLLISGYPSAFMGLGLGFIYYGVWFGVAGFGFRV